MREKIVAVLSCEGDETTEQELTARIEQLAGNFGYGDVKVRIKRHRFAGVQPEDVKTTIAMLRGEESSGAYEDVPHAKVTIEDGHAIARFLADGEDEEGRYAVMNPHEARSTARLLLAAAQEIAPVHQGLGSEELVELLESTEARERELKERWEKLQAKVATAFEHCEQTALDKRGALLEAVQAMQEANLTDGTTHENETGKVMLRTDEMRRAYAIYDALRSVKIWMKGYL